MSEIGSSTSTQTKQAGTAPKPARKKVKVDPSKITVERPDDLTSSIHDPQLRKEEHAMSKVMNKGKNAIRWIAGAFAAGSLGVAGLAYSVMGSTLGMFVYIPALITFGVSTALFASIRKAPTSKQGGNFVEAQKEFADVTGDFLNLGKTGKIIYEATAANSRLRDSLLGIIDNAKSYTNDQKQTLAQGLENILHKFRSEYPESVKNKVDELKTLVKQAKQAVTDHLTT